MTAEPHHDEVHTEDQERTLTRTRGGPNKKRGQPFQRADAQRFEPRPPAEVVYLPSARLPVPLTHDDADAEDVTRARRRLPRTVPLLWAAMLAVAALMHAYEIDRRASLREPSAAELDLQARFEKKIRAAWRDLGSASVRHDEAASAASGRETAPTAAHEMPEPDRQPQPANETSRTAGQIARTEQPQADAKRQKSVDASQEIIASKPVEEIGAADAPSHNQRARPKDIVALAPVLSDHSMHHALPHGEDTGPQLEEHTAEATAAALGPAPHRPVAPTRLAHRRPTGRVFRQVAVRMAPREAFDPYYVSVVRIARTRP